MCIRDRYYIDDFEQTTSKISLKEPGMWSISSKPEKNPEPIFANATLNDNIEPVSYTHLDVYKRQILTLRSNQELPSTELKFGCWIRVLEVSRIRKVFWGLEIWVKELPDIRIIRKTIFIRELLVWVERFVMLILRITPSTESRSPMPTGCWKPILMVNNLSSTEKQENSPRTNSPISPN